MSEITNEDSANPSELYGTYTWKIGNFSEVSKKEMRSNVFEVGGHQWYILLYPQGCEASSHLSVFLCVANHHKLLPGWKHFALFTVSVMNISPNKSKHSDTLHEFYKREHDWGWKKLIELHRIQDGYIHDSGSLIIKAQVQVIRVKIDSCRKSVDGPFPCLDGQYRKELLRVYFQDVEHIMLKFMKVKRSKLMEDKKRWTSLCAFWLGMDQKSRQTMSREKMDVIEKLVVKHFFINKDVTSALVMDFLFKGLSSLVLDTKEKRIHTISKQIVNPLKDDFVSRDNTLKALEAEQKKERAFDAKELTAPIVSVDKDTFVLADDAILLLEKAVFKPFPDERVPPNRMEVDYDGERDDEKLLTEYARHTLEVFVLDHIFCNKIEMAYKDAIALKMQEELIREEEDLKNRRISSTKSS